MTDRARELLERAYQYIPMSSVTSQEIRAYLAEPEVKPEPLTYLFTHPAPRQEFVRLSDEEVSEILFSAHTPYEAVCATENRLVEKNK